MEDSKDMFAELNGVLGVLNVLSLASKDCWRFNTSKGDLCLEDLWKLPLTTTRTNGVSLDTIAKGLNRLLMQSASEVSFVDEEVKDKDSVLSGKLTLVKYIINEKKKENKKKNEELDKKNTLQAVSEQLQRINNSKFENMSEESLLALKKSLLKSS